MKFNQRYFLCWGTIKMSHGVLRPGKQEIVNHESDAMFDREKMANRQAETMNEIYGKGSHWIETDA